MRAGREPAEDLKRRLVAACREVGLRIDYASMHLVRDADSRVIDVGASLEDWAHQTPVLSVTATIPVTGDWPESVDIRCCATEESPLHGLGPWLQGRTNVPLNQLVDQLRETLQEREQVIAASMAGIAGPYSFRHTVWRTVDLFDSLNP